MLFEVEDVGWVGDSGTSSSFPEPFWERPRSMEEARRELRRNTRKLSDLVNDLIGAPFNIKAALARGTLGNLTSSAQQHDDSGAPWASLGATKTVISNEAKHM